MKIQLSAAGIILAAALSAEAATARAVQKNTGTFRAGARQAVAAPAAASTKVSFSMPGNNAGSRATAVSQPGLGFAAGNAAFGRTGRRGLLNHGNKFENLRHAPSRLAADPAPEPEQGPQPVAGALLLTAGRGFTVAPAEPIDIFAVDGGKQFMHEKTGGQALDGPGIRQGQSDTGGNASSGSGAVESPLGSALSK